MHFPQKIAVLFIATALSLTSFTKPDNSNNFTAQGRTEKLPDGTIALIGSASSVTYYFRGTQSSFKVQATNNHHNYIVLEVDGKYEGRKKIETTATPFTVTAKEGITHKVTVYKATEASNDAVIFLGAEGLLIPTPKQPAKKKIEFIGDSITCGMGNDIQEVPCGTGEWYDQHNAYYSYAPIAARELDADYLLSSVSGIGMYRNWNDEHIKEAIMPDVYNNLYLNKDSSKPYDHQFKPEVTCIALGTNDFSDGDGKNPRLPFNEEKYVANYIAFVTNIYKYAPDTQVVLLNSPMVSGEKNETFIKCLTKVQRFFNGKKDHKTVKIFTFTAVTPHGCGYHPEIEDDKLMASQLAPFLKPLLNEKK